MSLHILCSDTRLEIDLQSIAECTDLLETPTTGKPYTHTHPLHAPLLLCNLMFVTCRIM